MFFWGKKRSSGPVVVMAGGAPGWSTGTGAMVREPPVEVKGLLSYVKGYGEQSYLLGKQPSLGKRVVLSSLAKHFL